MEIDADVAMPRLRPDRHGVSLLELLVVITIISIMLTMLFPAIQMVRSASMRSSCSNNRHNLRLGLNHYKSLHKQFPPPPIAETPSGWSVKILPFVESQNLYDAFNQKRTLSDPQNMAAAQMRPSVFVCPFADYRDSVIAGVPAAHYMVHVYDPNHQRRGKFSWNLMDTSKNSQLPWCSGPEVSEVDWNNFENFHPESSGLGNLID